MCHVDVRRYAETSFVIEASWQEELAAIIAQEANGVWTEEQQRQLDAGIPVWLSLTIVIQQTPTTKE